MSSSEEDELVIDEDWEEPTEPKSGEKINPQTPKKRKSEELNKSSTPKEKKPEPNILASNTPVTNIGLQPKEPVSKPTIKGILITPPSSKSKSAPIFSSSKSNVKIYQTPTNKMLKPLPKPFATPEKEIQPEKEESKPLAKKISFSFSPEKNIFQTPTSDEEKEIYQLLEEKDIPQPETSQSQHEDFQKLLKEANAYFMKPGKEREFYEEMRQIREQQRSEISQKTTQSAQKAKISSQKLYVDPDLEEENEREISSIEKQAHELESKQKKKKKGRKPLTALNPNIPLEEQRRNPKKITVNLQALYQVFISTKGQPLESVYQEFYRVLKISQKEKEKESYRLMKEKIHYKLKNLLVDYSFLQFYGHEKLFTLARLYECPEILITEQDNTLKQKFENAVPQRRHKKKINDPKDKK